MKQARKQAKETTEGTAERESLATEETQQVQELDCLSRISCTTQHRTRLFASLQRCTSCCLAGSQRNNPGAATQAKARLKLLTQ